MWGQTQASGFNFRQFGHFKSIGRHPGARGMENMGATRIYQEKDLGKTVIYKPAEQRKPIYGWLVVTEGPDTWKDFRLADEEVQLFLGKDEECQL